MSAIVVAGADSQPRHLEYPNSCITEAKTDAQ